MKRSFKIPLIVVSTIIFLYGLGCLGIYFNQEKFLFHPQVLNKDHQYEFSLPVKEANIITEHQDTLNTILIKTHLDSSKGVVFFLHGNTGNLQVFGHAHSFFTDRGYDFFMYDYQGFGKSSGQIQSKKILSNARAVLDQLLKTYPEENIIIYGQSIGTGMASSLAAQINPRHLILEAPYYNLEFIADLHMPSIPTSWLLKYKLKTNEFLKNTKCPVTIFHGTKDRTIPFINAKKLSKMRNLNLVTIEGGAHNNLSTYPLYLKSLTKILNS
ncbi:MAG: alpha/beta hydrolase [Flavobacteriales bacterium]|nr:alpha/beta hydrolase [Flavobacteriales bacterium]